MDVSYQVKHTSPLWPMIPLLGVDPREMKTCVPRKTYPRVPIAALFITATNWKQLQRPSTREWVNNSWYIYTIECDLVIKRNITPDTGSIMNESHKHYAGWKSQIQKRVYCRIFCSLSSGLVKLTLGRDTEEWFPMEEERGVGLTKKGAVVIFYILSHVWASQVCICPNLKWYS